MAILPGELRAQTANTVNLAESVCVADSITLAPEHDYLMDGLHSVSLNWTASISAPDWYRIYRGTATGGPYSLIADCIRTTNYADFSVSDGQKYFYVTTAVQYGLESVNSGEALASIPVQDSLTTVHGHFITLSDSLSTSDALVRRQVLNRSASETLSTDDVLTRQAAHFRAVSETLSTTAGMAGTFTDPNSINLTEGLVTSDSLARSAVLSRSLADTITSEDSISPEQIFGIVPTGPAPQIFFLGNYGVAAAGTCNFTLSVFGRYFNNSSIVTWNGATRPTTYLSPTALQVMLGASDLATAGAMQVAVMSPGGVTSQPKVFTVVSSPVLSSVRIQGGALIADGANFVPDSTLFWNGQALTTSWISYTRLEAPVPSGIRAIGSNTVSVIDIAAVCF